MLTLVGRRPRITVVPWDKIIRLCRRTCEQAVARRSRSRQLKSLSRLDDRLLADIGLTREVQMVECSKLFWSFP